MLRVVGLCSIVLLFSVLAHAQTPAPSPPQTGQQPRQPTNAGVEKDRFDRLRSIEMLSDKPQPTSPLLDKKKGIYRRPGKEETKALAVDASLLAKYAEFLKLPDTGIVKLNSDSSCVSNAAIVTAQEGCADFSFPGAGTSYSFRTNGYCLPRLADVTLYNGSLLAGGIFQQELLVNLGDVPIQDLTLEHPSFRYLNSLPILRDSDEFTNFRENSKSGIDANGFAYRVALPATKDSSYALRSVAYRAQYLRSLDGIKYDELDYDKRRDVMVVFRTVDRDTHGNITLLWRVLKDVDAPKLKTKK